MKPWGSEALVSSFLFLNTVMYTLITFYELHRLHLFRLQIPYKGTTINDRGAEEISEMNLFFPGNPFRIKKIFPEKGFRNFFFSRFPPALPPDH